MIRIALDGLGGEAVPAECWWAIGDFLKKNNEAIVVLATGDVHFAQVMDHLDVDLRSRLRYAAAHQRVDFDESPVKALKAKPHSSIAVAVNEMSEGRCEAVVSFGHTGAAVVAAQLKLGLLPCVQRSGLGAIVPNAKGFGLLMDVGANLKSRPEHLLQYGVMADVYCQSALGIQNPRVGLLNVGEEPGKGDERLQATYDMFCSKGDFNFVGNVEGGQIFDGSVDAIICNGLEGNMVLKAAESLANMLFHSIEDRLSSELLGEQDQRTKWAISSVAARHDPDARGASRLLGVQGLVLIGHGNARREAILSALESARSEVELGLQPALMGRLAKISV
jgi:glycerol-3-phosphate acyltransferase PlsX